MLPVRVAVVPYAVTGNLDAGPSPAVLLRVAAALQTQMSRDVGPVWGVSAIVSPFLSLDQVPPGYLPLVIVVGSKLRLNRQGFHLVEARRPAAFVEYGDGWPVDASHELIEMVCDPWGTRTAPGPSLGDEMHRAGAASLDRLDGGYELQGHVEYLMEICDPCENSTYTIDGVYVSDFVTPHYYGVPNAGSDRYSFTGRLDAPLQLLEEGYITWSAESGVWQAFASGGDGGGQAVVPVRELEIRALSDQPVALSRQWVDAHPDAIRGERGRAPKPPAPGDDDPAARSYGERLQEEIALRVKSPIGRIDAGDSDAIDYLSRIGYW
jgi:hypothetical protein